MAEAAQAELQRVLILNSGNREALAALASLNLSRKKLDDAREWYKRLLNADPNSRDAYYCQQDIVQANEWVGKTLAAKREAVPRKVAVFGAIEHALIESTSPDYPPLALQAGVHGIVRLKPIVGTDGAVRDAQIIRGHPLLVPAAIEVVKKYVYKPTLLNGQPIEVETTVDVNFVLPRGDRR